MSSAFNWRGQPSEIGAAFIKVSGTGAPPKDHPLRNGKAKAEANKVGSKSRAPTANISGQRS